MNEWVGTQKNGHRFTGAARVMLSFVEALGGDRQAHDDRQEGEQGLGVRAPEIQTRRVSGRKNFLNWCTLGLCIIFGGPFSQNEYAPFSEQKNFRKANPFSLLCVSVREPTQLWGIDPRDHWTLRTPKTLTRSRLKPGLGCAMAREEKKRSYNRIGL